ncbi:MAG: exodeoxyribonuclease III [Saprospiraceae bacterium]
MKIISYNVNGIRSALSKGLAEWISQGDYDIICIQEIKAEQDQVDGSIFVNLGYPYQYWNSAEKKGYSGTLTLSKKPATFVTKDSGLPHYDREGRILRTDFDSFTLLNCYFPSGTSGDERQGFKMIFLQEFHDYILELKKEQNNIIIVGDYNIAHNEIDIHDPKGNKNSTGFLPEERAWMTKWFGAGFIDAFRFMHPDRTQYSWWSYRAGSRVKNKGWRIDYQSVSENLKDKILMAELLNDAIHSDHCPVLAEYDLVY